MSSSTDSQLADVAQRAVELARRSGAKDASAEASRSRQVEVQWRDGKLEKISEATTRGLGLRLYVDGRFSSVSTSDLRPEALSTFVQSAIALTRKLAPDPARQLPDPAYYRDRMDLDLELTDPKHGDVSAVERRRRAQAIEAGARQGKETSRILSVSTDFSDTRSDSYLVTSNGFAGGRSDTQFWMSGEVSMKDDDGRRPEEYSYAGSRFLGELPAPEALGREASERAAGRLGSKKAASAVMAVVVDNRVAGRLLGALGAALNGGSLQQKRSFLEGKKGQKVGSERLEVSDDPHIKRGFGSRLYDREGMTARTFPVFRAGVLEAYYLDSYYARKLAAKPTTGGPSNLRWKLGTKDRARLLSDMKEGILITQFLGGNSNSTTGDFSLGFAGFRVKKGAIAEPVAEMNLSGNHLELWKRLAAVGNDPYPYSSSRTPSLLFDGVQVAGA